MLILIFLSSVRFMVENKTRHSNFHCQLNYLKGDYEHKIELLGFFHVTGVILHSITRNSENVNKPGSEVFTNMKVNMTVRMSIMQLEKIIKLCKMEMSTSLHQDIDEFYDNISDTILDHEMIALYIIF